MKYVVMCVLDRGGEFPDPIAVEYSGEHHPDRESARREMRTIGRRTRERRGITNVYIKEACE